MTHAEQREWQARVTTTLKWGATSSLTESNCQGGRVFYAYDASGQRVVQARMADAGGAGGTATAYTAAGQLDDPDTASTSTGDVTGTRYYTFAGATVAVRTVTVTEAGRVVNLAFLFGDEQGSTSVMIPAQVGASGAVAPATLADASAATRTAYTPYGALRGEDNAALDRGWLGQVEDRVDGATGTGLTYLNARYYDPATMRFISPDPLMNPGDPKTLDPYRYADNNPVMASDASGLAACYGLSAENEKYCKWAWNRSQYSVATMAAYYQKGAGTGPDGKNGVNLAGTKNPFERRQKEVFGSGGYIANGNDLCFDMNCGKSILANPECAKDNVSSCWSAYSASGDLLTSREVQKKWSLLDVAIATIAAGKSSLGFLRPWGKAAPVWGMGLTFGSQLETGGEIYSFMPEEKRRNVVVVRAALIALVSGGAALGTEEAVSAGGFAPLAPTAGLAAGSASEAATATAVDTVIMAPYIGDAFRSEKAEAAWSNDPMFFSCAEAGSWLTFLPIPCVAG